MSLAFNVGFGSNVQDIQQRINNLQTEKQNIDNEYTNASNEKSTFDGQKSSAVSNEQSAQQAVASAKENVASAQSALSEAQNTPVETKTNADGTKTKDTSKRDAAIKNAQTILNTAKLELEKAQTEDNKAKEEVEKINKQIDEIQNKLNEINSQKDSKQQEIDSAKNELQTAAEEEKKAKEEQEAKEKDNKDADDKNKNDLNSLNNFNLFAPKKFDDLLDNNFFNHTENKKDEVTEEEFKDLANDAKIILNKDSYSADEVNKVQKEIELLTKTNFDLNNEDVKKYADLANDLKEYNDKQEEAKADEIEKEVLEIFKDINKDYGVSEDVINAVAQSYQEIGVSEIEGKDNKGEMEKYQQSPNGDENGAPWCASFVSWAYGKSQNSDNEDTFGYENAVRLIRADAERAGFYESKDTYNPVAGDIMIQENNGASHTGLVVKEDNNYVYTIEGNAGNKVRAKKYNKNGIKYKDISGYVKMNKWKGGTTNPINIDYLPDNKYEDADKDLNQSTL